jgi:hypothetical protein
MLKDNKKPFGIFVFGDEDLYQKSCDRRAEVVKYRKFKPWCKLLSPVRLLDFLTRWLVCSFGFRTDVFISLYDQL